MTTNIYSIEVGACIFRLYRAYRDKFIGDVYYLEITSLDNIPYFKTPISIQWLKKLDMELFNWSTWYISFILDFPITKTDGYKYSFLWGDVKSIPSDDDPQYAHFAIYKSDDVNDVAVCYSDIGADQTENLRKLIHIVLLEIEGVVS